MAKSNFKRSAKGKGFQRLKGLAAVGAIGAAGLMGAPSARAASQTVYSLWRTATRSSSPISIYWSEMLNNSRLFTGNMVTTSNGRVFSGSGSIAFGINDATLITGTATGTGSGWTTSSCWSTPIGPSGTSTLTCSTWWTSTGPSGPQGFGDAFDNALHLGVNGNWFVNPTNTVDLTNNTITTDTVAMSGVNVNMRYHFFGVGDAVQNRAAVRALYSFTNPTGSPIDLDVLIAGDLGSDSSTEVINSYSGDAVMDAVDYWVVSDDAGGTGTPSGVGSDPTIIISRYGDMPAVMPFNALPLENSTEPASFASRYPVTVPAGETVRLLAFIELIEDNYSLANSHAVAYESLDGLATAGLLEGLSQTEIDEVVNYGFAPMGPMAKNDTDGDGDSDILWQNPNSGFITVWQMENKSKVGVTELGGLGNNYSIIDTNDLDGDGDSDLVLFDAAQGRAIQWEMENNAKIGGSLLATFPGYTIRGLGDVDADGDGDIIWQAESWGGVILWIMEGGVKQSGSYIGSLGSGSVVEAIGDFDNDGDDDLIWSVPGNDSLVRWDMQDGAKVNGSGIGGFAGYSVVEVGDYNNDGTDDILWEPNGGGSSSIIWLMANGAKSSGTAVGTLTGYSIAITGDYDADGDDDILWKNGSGQALIWELENAVKQAGNVVDTKDPASEVKP